jgi:hypothetical protein
VVKTSKSLIRVFIAALVLSACIVNIRATQATENGDDTFYVRSAGYWKTHNAYATVPALCIPWPIPEDTLLCGLTFYEILNTSPKGCPWLTLARQWIAAMLDALSGALLPDDILAQLGTAEILLRECRISPFDIDLYFSLASVLEQYNEGLAGPAPPPD